MKQLQTTYGTLDDFESVMTDLCVCAPGSHASTLPHHMRPYLIGDIEEGITEYFNAIRPRPALLCDQLAQCTRHGDVVLTFNYELSIERSLSAAGLWHINDGYGFRLTPEGGTSPVRILKLHGSTNWRGLLFGGSTGFGGAENSLGARPVLCFRPDFEYLGFPDVTDPFYGHLATAATTTAMIMPALNKMFFQNTTFGKEWQPFWDVLWGWAARALDEADEIVLIGYSMPTADQRARALLLDNPNKGARVIICAHSATMRIAEEFRKSGYTNVTEPANPTFAGWITGSMRFC
jgi:hypothetical protein